MKRIRKSKFDPYINEIKEYVAAGMSVVKIAEQLDQYFDDIVSKDSLYSFIKAKNLQTIYPGGKNQTYLVPKCDLCDCCHEVIGFNDNAVKICGYTRLIPGSVKTSPFWCHKRERRAV